MSLPDAKAGVEKKKEHDGNFQMLPVWKATLVEEKTVVTRRSQVLIVREAGAEDEIPHPVIDDDEDDLIPQTAEFVSTGCCRHLILHPHIAKKLIWDLISLVLVVYDLFFIPLGFFPIGDGLFITVMKWWTRIFWSLDFPASFVCGFVTANGSIELRASKIAKRYFKSWFVLDFVVVGVDWLEYLMKAQGGALGFARFGKASRVLRILRMIRLLRLARMREVLDNLVEKFNSEKLIILIDIVKLISFMLGGGHVIACLWYLVSTGSEPNWVSQKEADNPGLYLKAGCDPDQEALDNPEKDGPNACGKVDQLYIMSLRWAITQFAGGMDEVTPVHFAEHLFAAFIYLYCFWSGAVFISILTSSMTNLYMTSSTQAIQLTTLRRCRSTT
jgi:hypothetical protein